MVYNGPQAQNLPNQDLSRVSDVLLVAVVSPQELYLRYGGKPSRRVQIAHYKLVIATH